MDIKITRRLSDTPDLPLLDRIFTHRNCVDSSDIDLALKDLIPPDSLSDIDKAAKKIAAAIIENASILVVGDFDADGATSIAIMLRALKAFGAQHVKYIVPNRFEDGYGLTPSLLKRVKSIPELLITVDNGIASVEGVAFANSLGITVIVTDHHLPGDIRPDAYAIVNPNQQGDLFPSKHLAGVGVAFYLLIVVLRQLKEMGRQDLEHVKMTTYLDLVAFGTVADVVKLDKNNRILVQYGLNRIRKGFCIEGIKNLVRVSGKNLNTLCTSDIGFALAPRLNAAGRLDDMSFGIECLLTDDPNNAFMRAQTLDELNVERRAIEHSMVADAEKILQTCLIKSITDIEMQSGIVIFDPNFHQGVIGIVASRLKDKFNRPVIVFAEDDLFLKGSGRSIIGLHLRDALDWVDKKYPGIILKFGGHAMAAGLTLSKQHLSIFERAFCDYVDHHIDISSLTNEILSDGSLETEQMNIAVVEQLKFAAPWGQGFPEPVFDDIFEVIDYRVLKDTHLKLRLKKKGCHQEYEGIAFFKAKYYLENPTQLLHCVFKLDQNTWGNETKLQLLIDGYRRIYS